MSSILVVGAPADAAVGLTADAVLDQVIDTDHADRQVSTEAGADQLVCSLLQDQGETAIIDAGAWEEGKDPVTWAEADGLSELQTFIRDGELMPIEEIRADDARREAFFISFLSAEDGGADVLRIMYDQVQEATGSGAVIAADDYNATGG
ncbi:hypothetical protein [Georgenia sunbinii]|uniref:hypothetical protein n=1 Tax=Georgenia sunbinii TaxID=3117728 RepID=UPI002F268746